MWNMINKTRCIYVAGVYEWVYFDADPIIIIILFKVWWLHDFSWQISYLFINWILGEENIKHTSDL